MLIRQILIAVVFVLLSAAAAFAQKAPLLNFDDLKKFDPVRKEFQIEGFVFDTYKCPPCPPGAMCKPCIPDNVTLVKNSDWTDLSGMQRLRVYTEETDKFKPKQLYRLTVKITGNVKAGDTIDSVVLISFEALPTGKHAPKH